MGRQLLTPTALPLYALYLHVQDPPPLPPHDVLLISAKKVRKEV